MRMLRALRFAAQLGFEVEEQTFAANRELAQTIEKISAERIQTELVKLLTSDHPELMREVYTSGISDVILPEFSVLMQTEQNNPHHCYTVGEHTIHVVQQVENQKVLRLAALFAQCGIDTVRITGGEPLVRRGVEQLTAGLNAIPGIRRVALTTNGVLLAQKLPCLLYTSPSPRD